MRIIPLLLLFALCACNGTPPAGTIQAPVVADTIAKPITDGHQVLYTKDGGRMEGELRDGLRTGPWASYFASGGIRSRSTYVDGLEEGPTEVFHENGLTYYTGAYHRGKSAGEWIFYDPQGKEMKRVSYDSTGVLLK